MENEYQLQVNMNNSKLRTSESTVEIKKALLKVSKGITPVEKNTNNPFYKSKYANLESVWNMLNPLLVENDLGSLNLPTIDSSNYLEITTHLFHGKSGEWLEFDTRMPLSKSDPQGFGMAITYARRYILMSFFGIPTEEDDDGNSASGKLPQKPQQKVKPAPQKDPTEIRKEVIELGQVVYGDTWDDNKVKLVSWASGEKQTDVNKADYNTLNKMRTGLLKRQKEQT
jgi:hypothetical protein